jgi:peptidoglycan/LPS O-acetylase OafA/YrhL
MGVHMIEMGKRKETDGLMIETGKRKAADGLRLARTGIRSFGALDGLRGYMAWCVVFVHAIQITGWTEAMHLTFLGDTAVHVFIILSGFVITHLLIEKDENYAFYIRRRAFRIFPIYIVSLAAAILLTSAHHFSESGAWVPRLDWRMDRAAATAANFYTHLLLHLPLIHGLVPDNVLPFSSLSILGPAWTLSLEWQFYLVAPFIVRLIAKRGMVTILTVFVFLAVWWLFRHSPLRYQAPSVLPLAIHWFLVGILSRIYFVRLARFMYVIAPLSLAAFLLSPHRGGYELLLWGWFITAAFRQYHSADTRSSDPRFYGKIRGAAAAAGNWIIDKIITPSCANRLARNLGEASYSTYLIHVPCFSLAIALAAKGFGEWNQQIAIIAILCAIVSLAPISRFLYLTIEKPMMRLGARRLSEARVKPGEAVSGP